MCRLLLPGCNTRNQHHTTATTTTVEQVSHLHRTLLQTLTHAIHMHSHYEQVQQAVRAQLVCTFQSSQAELDTRQVITRQVYKTYNA
jgi:hypothetical protein